MSDIALYFPYASLPADDWVKAAALCWPQIARICPDGDSLIRRDSDTVNRLRDELNFVVNVFPTTRSDNWERQADEATLREVYGEFHRPDGPTEDASALFLAFLHRNREELVAKFGRQTMGIESESLRFPPGVRSVQDCFGPALEDPRLQVLYFSKFTHRAIDELTEAGLLTYVGLSYVAVHRAVAAVYLAILADGTARRNGMTPITDQPVHCAATHGWTVEALAEILLGADEGAGNRYHQDYTHVFASLALQTVLPRDIQHIPVTRIIEARQRLLPELIRYREFLDSLVPDLIEISAITDPTVRDAKLNNKMESQIKQRLMAMEREIGNLGMQPARAVLSMNSLAPPAALAVLAESIALPPIVTGSGMAAGCLAGATYSALDNRRQVLAAEPVGYLLSLRSELGPSDTVARIRSAVRRTVHRRDATRPG